MPPNPLSRRRLALILVAVFAAAFAGSLLLHRASALHDTDAYYHLAVARAYWHEGLIDELPWTRFSLLHDGFGDKELLFHLLLAPLAGTLEPLVAGRLALALLAAALATALAALAVRAVGAWGALVPFWIFFASTEFAWRTVRLRPELVALLLFLAAIWAIGHDRPRVFGALAFLFTWAYTAFHALVGFAFLVALWRTWTRRRLEARLPLYGLAGAGLALVLHPHFPKSLEVWSVQNIRFFLDKGLLNVGTEIRPNFTDVALMVNLGWLLGLVVLWRSAPPAPANVAPANVAPAEATNRRLAEASAIAALVFGALYLLMSRFSLYAVPFTTLACLFALRRRGRRPGAWTALPGRGRVPLAVAAAFCLLVSLPEAVRQHRNYAQRTDLGPDSARIRDRQALAAALPDGARVAADWGPTATLMLWAPHGRYLNALDPLFMAAVQPAAQALLRSVLEAREPDIPAAVTAGLDSEYLVYATVGHGALDGRLAADPRVEFLHRGSLTLVRFRAPATPPFVLDWRLVPGDHPAGVEPAEDLSAWPVYPRRDAPAAGSLEGYVDAERLAPEVPCIGFVRDLELDAERPRELLVSPWGPSTVWLDGRRLSEIRGELRAIPGRGIVLPLPLTAGRHRLTVRTCEGSDGRHKGFYASGSGF